ncbi:MAG: hypothetical protein MJZ15_05990 [Bacteroidales bacterium]|nr:hypothetical protein [Bacteroidales bacterium]
MKLNIRSLFVAAVSLLAIEASAQNKYPQISNSDFESWEGYSNNNHEPDNWNSFETVTGGLANTAHGQQVDRSEDVRPDSEGKYSVKIYSRNIMNLANAQGNLTLGRINAGSTTANSAGNHNFSDVSSDEYSQALGVQPDSIVAWVKFVPNNDTYLARMTAVVHDKYNYIVYGSDKYDNDANRSHVAASCELNFPAVKDEEENYTWQRLSLPFVRTDNDVKPGYIIVNFATNSVPGGGSDNDVLYVDDVELIYNPKEIEEGTYYLRNVATGKWLSSGGGSNPKAAMTDTPFGFSLKLSEGLCSFSTGLTGETADNHFLGFVADDEEELSMVGTKSMWKLANVSGNVFTLALDGRYLTAAGMNVAVAENDGENSQWELMSEADMKEISAGAWGAKPEDITYLIANANFDNGSNGWECVYIPNQTLRSGVLRSKDVKQNLNIGGDNPICELYNETPYFKYMWYDAAYADISADVSQTISVNNGWYKVTMQGFYRYGEKSAESTTTNPYFYVNGNKKTLPTVYDGATDEQLHEKAAAIKSGKFVPNDIASASAYFSAGLYTLELLVEVTDGQMVVGVHKDTYKANVTSWTCFDNFQITYYGVEDPVEPSLKIEEPTVKEFYPGEEVSVPYEYFAGMGKDIESEDAISVALVQENSRIELTGASVLENGELKFIIPSDTEAGEYSIVLSVNGSEVAMKSFDVTIKRDASFVVTFPEETNMVAGNELSVEYTFVDSYPQSSLTDDAKITLFLSRVDKEVLFEQTFRGSGVITGVIPGVNKLKKGYEIHIETTTGYHKYLDGYVIYPQASLTVEYPSEIMAGEAVEIAYTFVDSYPSALGSDIKVMLIGENDNEEIATAQLAANGTISFTMPEATELGTKTLRIEVDGFSVSDERRVTVVENTPATAVDAIEETDVKMNIYDISGKRIATGVETLEGLPRGLYIVERNGKTEKIMVR